MSGQAVWVFFYGSFINLDVLKQVGYVPERYEVARLHGFDIQIRPLANIVWSDSDSVYGIVALATHADLERLYGQDWVGTYLPHPVVVSVTGGTLRPALTYIAPDMKPKPPVDDYVDRIIGPARRLGFPDWYVERLEKERAPDAEHLPS